MSKCDNCKIRKFYAKAFDLHWLGEDDCPYECDKKTPDHIGDVTEMVEPPKDGE